jgi:hypothetical protein
MLSTRIYSRSALLAGALLCLLLVPSCALAAGSPAAVSVRVEGLTATKLPATAVTTTNVPVVKDGKPEDSCSGTSALGALQLATAGNWSGPWEAKFNQYTIYTIEGETHEFEASASANYFWSFWLNNKESEVGACEAELQPGDQVLFFPACFGSGCPASPTPLGIEAPATANSGENVVVTVKQYKADGSSAPVEGADVGGGGTGAITDAQGHATLKLVGDGVDTLTANGSQTGPPAVRAETKVCVHEGNDGTCGTPAPGVRQPPTFPLPLAPSPGPVIVKATGLLAGHVYSRRRAPRVLTGKVIAQNPLVSISIRLRRFRGRRCWAYSGSLERFVKVRCGHGGFFAIPTHGSSFSYLLPHALPRGRYVYEIKAADSLGDRSALAPGGSKIVFYVG